MNLDESKCLASLAVFRELHDSKKDVYEIISEFLREIISSNAKYQFNLTEISQLLNETYDFSIPDSVIKTAIKKLDFLKKEKGYYVVQNIPELNITSNITSKHTEISGNNEIIINSLFEYIENEINSKLNDDKKEIIVHELCNFILDVSSSGDYSELISAFIISNKNNTRFTQQLETIKEGVVLYSGIKYNSNINEFGSWNSELTIFLDMEILFHFAGYNGEIYKQSFDDFHFFVKKINVTNRNKHNKNLIHLKYFKEVRSRIEGFFEKSIHIFEGNGTQDPSNTAISSILDGCKSTSDIITKKTNFFILLKSSGILEDDFDKYYSPENHSYNIEIKVVIDELSGLIEEKDITSNLKYLNYINIHRKGDTSNNFYNVGYILLTGNSVTLNISWHESIKINGSVPLATTLDFLTNKFWFRLSRGFGDNNYPKSFGIITKAQILLSSKLSKSVGKKFEELQKDFRNGKLTEQQALSAIVELRIRAKKPEDIGGDDLKFILESISEENIEQFVKEQELFKLKASKQKDENARLKEDLSLKEKEVETHKLELKDIQQKILLLEEKEQKRIEKREKINKLLVKIFYLFSSVIIFGLGVILYKIDNKIIGSSVSLLASILAILTFLGIDYRSFLTICKRKTKKIT